MTPTVLPGGNVEIKDVNPEQLEAFLDLLVECGVEEFEGFGMHVRFTSAMFTKDKEVPAAPEEVLRARPEERAAPTSIWEVPELWPGGKPPRFPDNK